MKRILPGFIILFATGVISYGQDLSLPRPSTYAEILQTVGISTITVKYSRPSVKGRAIWGGVVPYGMTVQNMQTGKPSPWRAGANENTTITFSHSAKVEGKEVAAGTYGLFIVTHENNTAEMILSKHYQSWGSFSYNPEEDAMRASITMRDHDFTELLTYEFNNVNKNSAELALTWEKKQLPVKIEFQVDEIVIQNAKEELRGAKGFSTDSYINAAKYAFDNNVAIEQGKQWIDFALLEQPTNFIALRVKSRYLDREGRSAESDKLINDAMQVASENELITYGYFLSQALGLNGKAIKVLTVCRDRFPKSANAWDSLGEVLALAGEKSEAIQCFKKALSLNPSSIVKANSEKYLKELGNK